MRIRVTEDIFISGKPFKIGDITDVDERTAHILKGSARAEYVSESEEQTEPKADEEKSSKKKKNDEDNE